MAELNFGLLNPPGSQSIGNAFVQGMDQAAAARAQENQNALAQYQLSAAQRNDQTQTAINRAYQESIGPEGQIDYPRLQSRLAAGGAGSAIPKLQAERATAENLAARTEASKAATATSKFNLTHERANKAILDIADLPDAATAVASINRHLADGDIDEPKANALKAKLGDPTTFLAGRKEILRGMLAAKDRLAQDNVSTKDTDRGGYIERQTYDAQGIAVGDPIRINKTLTPGQVQTSADAKLGRDQSARQFAAGGYTYDLPAGVRYDRNGVASPLMQQAPAAADAAPASGVVPAAPASGGVPAGRNATGLVPVGPRPDKPTDTYFKEAKGIINTNYAINNLKEITNNFTAADMLNPARRAEIEAAHAAAVLLAKDMFGLGVLNEGDERILKKIIPDATSFSKGLVPIETIRKNLSAATNVINRMNETSAKVHKQPLLKLDSMTPSSPNPSAPPIQSFRR